VGSGGGGGASTPEGFEFHTVIGRGASSVVWKATQSSTGRAVALKMLDVDMQDREARRRFERERQAMSTLSNHPNIVTLYEAGIHQNRPWLALQLCSQGSFAARVARSGPLNTDEAVEVLIAIGRALSAAHEHHVLHCDVKPANIMIGDFGGPTLGDFGVARVAVGSNTRTAAGGYSLDHVAPELLDDHLPTVASDIYSLGTTVWELLCGRPPFRQSGDVSTAAVMRRILLEALPEPTVPDVPEPLVRLLSRMAAKDPAERPRAMTEIVAAALSLPVASGTYRTTTAVPDASDRSPFPEPGDLTETWIRQHRSGGPNGPARPAEVSAAPAAWVNDAGDLTPTQLFGNARALPPPSQPSDGPPAATKSRRHGRWIAAGVALVAAVGVGAAVLASATSGPAQPELILEAVTSAGPGPFAPDFGNAQSPLPGTSLASSTPAGIGAGSTVQGATEGLYRSAQDTAACDRDGLAAYYTDRPVLRAAWVGALRTDSSLRWSRGSSGVDPADLWTYFAELTPVLLRADVRVTDHSYIDNTVQPFQAILQAGTAVLVDVFGVPRVRCTSGSPLIGPDASGPVPVQVGQRWPGFEQASVLTVSGTRQAVKQFGLVDLTGSKSFRRPAGTTGPSDFDQVPANGALDGSYYLTGPQAFCDLNKCETSATNALDLLVEGCVAGQCVISSPDGLWDGAVALSADGETWRASTTLAESSWNLCGSNMTLTTFTMSFTVKDAAVTDGVWSASTLEGSYEQTTPEGECTAGRQSWNVSGTRIES